MTIGGVLWRALVAMLFPQQCVLCRAAVTNSNLSPVCPGCMDRLVPLPRRICHCCGIPVPGNLLETVCVCSTCRTEAPSFDWGRAWGSYEGDLRTLIRKFKYDRYRFLAAPLGSLLADCWRQLDSERTFHWIIPVPTHPRRIRARGFDPAALLARRLSRESGIPLFTGLKRVRHTPPQFGLSRTARKRNVRGAFRLESPGTLQGRNVILVDDILTTGATTGEICRILRQKSGVDAILSLVVARALVWAQSVSPTLESSVGVQRPT